MEAGEEDTTTGEQDAEVVQIIMHDDGQAVMPEGHFIQLNTEEGMQYIQVQLATIVSSYSSVCYPQIFGVSYGY